MKKLQLQSKRRRRHTARRIPVQQQHHLADSMRFERIDMAAAQRLPEQRHHVQEARRHHAQRVEDRLHHDDLRVLLDRRDVPQALRAVRQEYMPPFRLHVDAPPVQRADPTLQVVHRRHHATRELLVRPATRAATRAPHDTEAPQLLPRRLTAPPEDLQLPRAVTDAMALQ